MNADDAHERRGHVNSTEMHGETCPCSCAGQTALRGVPPDCQVAIVARCKSLPSGTIPQRKRARFLSYKAWASEMGIRKIRVEPPKCVRLFVEDLFGPSTTGFIAGVNPCDCVTCTTVESDDERPRCDTRTIKNVTKYYKKTLTSDDERSRSDRDE